ncbi:hypothetical protein ACE3MZ_08000 [Paenibacillus sp. WLX1005]|uniref:hypothetical protein n=1 Tax=Paenibacillus sp. WLX1005 TaxID=3243766 RepID=UPI00398402E7
MISNHNRSMDKAWMEQWERLYALFPNLVLNRGIIAGIGVTMRYPLSCHAQIMQQADA